MKATPEVLKGKNSCSFRDPERIPNPVFHALGVGAFGVGEQVSISRVEFQPPTLERS